MPDETISRPRTRRLVRWTGRWLAWTLVGVAIGVGVAWLCVLEPLSATTMSPERTDVRLADKTWMIRTFTGEYTTWHTAHERYAGSPDTPLTPDNSGLPWRVTYACRRFPHADSIDVRAFGWPMRCLWEAQQMTLREDRSAYPQFGDLAGVPMRGYPYRVLPVGLIPMGLVVNGLFYGTALWGIAGVIRFAIRALRRRRPGLCRECGYDLRGLDADIHACPECGAMRPPARS